MANKLNESVVEGGLRRVPFFNGRVLTAEDLQTEQDAHATERRRLGRALGTGVLDGLFVKQHSDTTVTVQSGHALAPNGQVIALPKETTVSVVAGIEREETAGTGGAFADCATRTDTSTVTSGAGVYLLFVEPAAESRGRTPRTRLGGDGAAGECGARHRLEGARLRLVSLDTADEALVPSSLRNGENGYDIQRLSEKIFAARESDEEPGAKPVSRLRNLLAQVCLRSPSSAARAASLYDTLRRRSRGERSVPVGADGPIDVLRKRAHGKLNDAVPLGLLYWGRDRIEFVDPWSVRRRIHRPTPNRPAPATARRRAETEAAIYQFQDHVADLVERLSFRERIEMEAQELFPFLPPFGTIPNEQSDREGFDISAFFDGLATREPLFVEGETIRHLVDHATRFDAFRTDTEQLIWRYHVREDVQSGREQQPSFVAFTSGFVPDIADPQYNLSRWGYATYGPGVVAH